MQKLSVRVQKLHKDAVLPAYGTAYAAGADLHALLLGETLSFAPGETRLVRTGLSMEIPEGFVGLIYARSGIATKRGLAPANKVGVLDSDYRGEVMVALHNHSDVVQTVEDGERIAQLVIAPYLTAAFEEAESLESTARGSGGFGSTGTK